MDEYIGIIKMFAGNFAPRGWAFCNGQLLSIAQNTALFSILGTTYGGNGQTTFALPDLQGRVPLGTGQGPGLSNYTLGEMAGTESTTLLITNLPPHNHIITVEANNSEATTSAPVNGSSIAATVVPVGRDRNEAFGFNAEAPNTILNGDTAKCAPVGAGQPIGNIQPYLAMNYIICLEGIFPSRN